MVEENIIGKMCNTVVSFMGYQPDVNEVIKKTIPAILDIVIKEKVDAVLLVPSWPLCSQSVGLIARSLEIEGVRTTLTSWNAKSINSVLPPRATITFLKRGMTLGHPNAVEQQKRILIATLNLLLQNSPLKPVILQEN